MLASFDPGESTGFALYDPVSKALVRTELILNGKTPILSDLFLFLSNLSPRAVVVESFHLYPGRAGNKVGSSFPEIEVIGCIRTYCQLNMVELNFQTAAQGKSIWSDDRLKQFGYYTENRHCRDAVRHALHFSKRHRELRDLW